MFIWDSLNTDYWDVPSIRKIIVHICKHVPKWCLLPVWFHFYSMCGYGMCMSLGNRIRNVICFLYTSVFFFFFSRTWVIFYNIKKSNYPLSGKTVTSEFANLFYEALDRHDSQRVQSFHQILLRKERNHQFLSYPCISAVCPPRLPCHSPKYKSLIQNKEEAIIL